MSARIRCGMIRMSKKKQKFSGLPSVMEVGGKHVNQMSETSKFLRKTYLQEMARNYGGVKHVAHKRGERQLEDTDVQ